MPELWPIYLIVGVALAFDFVNGLHDAANSIATVVSTRVLSPRWAVIWAAIFNFIAFLIFDQAVAKTIGKGIIVKDAATLQVVTAGLLGAIAWNLITWSYGLPSSSSHALIGGLCGAAVVYGGFDVLIWGGKKGLGMTCLFIVIAPFIGMVLGFIFMAITYMIFARSSPARVSGLFRKLQLLSAAAYSLGHGGNDAQKTMGVIMAVLIAAKQLDPKVNEAPLWVVLSCHAAMGLGTLMGGWRIVKTMGNKICKLQPVHGFSAETGGALSLYGATYMGIPVSTTHTITGAIVGVGSTRGIRAVKWGVAGRVVWAWILTIPASGLMAALFWTIFLAAGWRAA